MRSRTARIAAAALLITGGPTALETTAASPAAAADDGTLCGYSSAAGKAIMRYTGTPGQWTQIGDPPRMIYGNNHTLLATNPVTDHVFQHLSGTDWRWIGNPGVFTFVGTTVYGTPYNRSVIMQFSGVPGSWTAVGGPHAGLSGGPQGLISTQPGTYAAFLYTGTPHVWTPLGRPPGDRRIVYMSTTTDIYAVEENVGEIGGIFVRNKVDGSWVRINAPGLNVAVVWSGGFGIIAGTDDNLGDVYLYTGPPGVWKKISSPGFHFVVTDRTIYRQNHVTDEIYKYSGTPNVWTKIHNGLSVITRCP
ncbi:hypothetical protein [Streptosporangium sp. KLBMP 9127]|nr:hypothetical protein [Streptosporangium sp. KLBMP 9127]